MENIKYKHLKKGWVAVKVDGEEHYRLTVGADKFALPPEIVETSDEWVKIIEDGFEILQWENKLFKSKRDTYPNNPANYNILMVKRTTDFMVVQINEHIFTDEHPKGGIVNEIYEAEGKIHLKFGKTMITTLDEVRKQAVLCVVSVDGVKLYDGDKAFIVDDRMFIMPYRVSLYTDKSGKTIIFADLEEARKYVFDNSKIFSLNDIKSKQGVKELEDIAKQRLNMKS